MDRLWTPWRYAYITGKSKEMPKAGVPESLAAWPGDHECVFCNMLAATAYAVEHGTDAAEADKAAHIVARGQSCFVVLNAFPYNSGHVMVVPYTHESSLAALPVETAEELMRFTRSVERVLRKEYRPQGLNIGLNLGEAAGAGVADHLHLHAVPRWSGDTNFMTVLSETRILAEMLEDTFTRLHAGLAADTAQKTSP